MFVIPSLHVLLEINCHMDLSIKLCKRVNIIWTSISNMDDQKEFGVPTAAKVKS